MQLVVHDYCGHPFQVQLSRALARRGHTVCHAYCASNPTTPQGALASRAKDPPTLKIAPIRLPRPIDKQVLVRRWVLERAYGRRLAALIASERPDAVLMANTPLDAAAIAYRTCRRFGIPMVYWVQDLIGEASARILGARLGPIGRAIGGHYRRLERRLLRASNRVVGITEDFAPVAEELGVPPACYVTIPNWAPLDEIAARPRHNAWSRSQGADERFVFLYSGTLGFKHNPGLLLALAQTFANDPQVLVIVNSRGAAADWLRKAAQRAGLARLVVNSYQPYGVLPDVLGSADVLVCILEPEAGFYSVPSKVLTYHCAARPLLLAVPGENLVSRIVRSEQTGVVVDPRDTGAFVGAARCLYGDGDLRRQMAARARAYAERTFDIDRIAGEFERVLEGAVGREAVTPAEPFEAAG